MGFDGSTTVEEFMVTLNQEIGCRDVSQSGFALFSDDPIEKEEEHWLEPRSKVISKISLVWPAGQPDVRPASSFSARGPHLNFFFLIDYLFFYYK